MSKDGNGISYIMSFITTTLGAIELDTIQGIVTIILGVLSFIISVSYTLFKWYKLAKSDGKITIDEVEDLFNEIENTINITKKDE